MESIIDFTMFYLVKILSFCYTIVGDDVMNKVELPACPVEITLSLMAANLKIVIYFSNLFLLYYKFYQQKRIKIFRNENK